MRDAYHEELDALTDQLVEMTRLVGSAISRATTALLDADLTLAESVIAADDAVDALRDDLDERAFDLLARQQPVATDLRIVVTSLQMSADLERMGDLAQHVAKVARRRYPDSAVPARAARDDRRDGPGRRADGRQGRQRHRLAGRRGRARARARRRRDGPPAPRSCSPSCSTRTGRTASRRPIDVTLLGRYYERFADHAVVGGPPRGLPGHRRAARRTLRRARLTRRQRPWFSTASIAAVGGLRVEVLAAGDRRAQVARRARRAAGCRSGCSARRCPRRRCRPGA